MNGQNHSSHDSTDSPNAIAALAYRYYLAEGRPEGRSQEHWLRAEMALRAPTKPVPSDVNGVPKAEISRLDGEGGPVTPAHGHTEATLSATREQIREQTSAVAHAPRQSLRPQEKSRRSR